MAWTKSYIYLGGRLLATEAPLTTSTTEIKYQHPDRLGTRLVTSSTSAVVSENISLPFGATISGESLNLAGSASKKRFTSYDRSDTTKLDYALNRHYSSAQGRFTQVDPIGMSATSLGNPQSLNLYAYCGNDPINQIDPDGLFSFKNLIGSIYRGFAKVAAVILVVAVIIALSMSGPAAPGAMMIFKMVLGAVKFAIDGWGNGNKFLQYVSAGIGVYLGFSTGGSLAKTNPTFGAASGSIIGAVSGFVQTQPKPPLPVDYGIIRGLALAFIQRYNARSIAKKREYGGEICRNSSGQIYATPARRGTVAGFTPRSCPNSDARIGEWHTHGANTPGYDNENFSGVSGGNPNPVDDINWAEIRSVPLFLGTPSGAIKVYIPNSSMVQGPSLSRINGGRFITFKERTR